MGDEIISRLIEISNRMVAPGNWQHYSETLGLGASQVEMEKRKDCFIEGYKHLLRAIRDLVNSETKYKIIVYIDDIGVEYDIIDISGELYITTDRRTGEKGYITEDIYNILEYIWISVKEHPFFPITKISKLSSQVISDSTIYENHCTMGDISHITTEIEDTYFSFGKKKRSKLSLKRINSLINYLKNL